MKMGIILHMANFVESYIYEMKGVIVSINITKVLTEQDELNKLIDAFNHAKKQNFTGNIYKR